MEDSKFAPLREIYGYVCSLIDKEEIIYIEDKDVEKKEINIFIPRLNVGIDFDLLELHSEDAIENPKYHREKLDECNANGIKLLQIFEDEYIECKPIVFSKIEHILGITPKCKRIMARKCKIKEIDKKDAKAFLKKNHIQGSAPATVFLGGFYKDRLVGVMGFKKEWNDLELWDLVRYATDNSTVCVGLGGKLFNHFVRAYKPDRVKSFADRRWTLDINSNLYIRLGFTLGELLNPDYRYIVDKQRIHKFNFRKKPINKKYGLPLTMTEKEMMRALKIPRIYDCGLARFEWYPPKEEEKVEDVVNV